MRVSEAQNEARESPFEAAVSKSRPYVCYRWSSLMLVSALGFVVLMCAACRQHRGGSKSCVLPCRYICVGAARVTV